MICLLERETANYDEFDGKVVRAGSEREAREIANQNPGCEGKIWTDETKVTCELVEPLGESGEILGSFNAG